MTNARSDADARRLRDCLRLLAITDGRGDAVRIERQVEAAIQGGVRAVQVREPLLGSGALATLCSRLSVLLTAVDGLLFVNDRADLVASGDAHGVQLPSRGLDVERARRVVGPGAPIGVSVHDSEQLAQGTGADFVLLAPVFATASKPAAIPLGIERARDLTRSSGIPMVWLGGIDLDSLRQLGRGLPPHRDPHDSGLPVGFASLSAWSGAEREVRERCRALVDTIGAILARP